MGKAFQHQDSGVLVHQRLCRSPSYSIENSSATTQPQYFKAYRRKEKKQFLSSSQLILGVYATQRFSHTSTHARCCTTWPKAMPQEMLSRDKSRADTLALCPTRFNKSCHLPAQASTGSALGSHSSVALEDTHSSLGISARALFLIQT